MIGVSRSQRYIVMSTTSVTRPNAFTPLRAWRWNLALLSIALPLALSGCGGTKPTIEQAINCDQFKQSPRWKVGHGHVRFARLLAGAVANTSRITLAIGSIIAEKAEPVALLSALNKKCGSKQ